MLYVLYIFFKNDNLKRKKKVQITFHITSPFNCLHNFHVTEKCGKIVKIKLIIGHFIYMPTTDDATNAQPECDIYTESLYGSVRHSPKFRQEGQLNHQTLNILSHPSLHPIFFRSDLFVHWINMGQLYIVDQRSRAGEWVQNLCC